MKSNLIKYTALSGFFALSISSCSVQNKTTSKSGNSVSKSKPASGTSVTKPPKPIISEINALENYKVDLPEINREFRGAWIASVANINWPSRNNLTTDQQKEEAIKLLDLLKNSNFNAVIFQVRPSSDALYSSSLEPWSYYLTGEIGKAPNPYYDPLQFWIDEAHKRGMELHVWLNPFRAHHSNGGKVTSASLASKMSDITIRLRNGMYWFDPGSEKTQNHASAVVKDIVKRYDIDGLHFDDYFYPYATYNNGADFPDSKTWNVYKNAGGTLSRADWRRDNVNRFVERIYKEIKAEKPEVKFGISPFGIWRPGFPEGVTGSSQYDELYADAKLWLNKGWVDYFSPQLYWPINSKGQSFPALLKWWQHENTFNRHLWPGLNTVEIKTPDKVGEIANQITETRQILLNSKGAIHWSIAGLTKSPAMTNNLKINSYKDPALVPNSSWLKHDIVEMPNLNIAENASSVVANWFSKKPLQVNKWVVFARYGNDWEQTILDKAVVSQVFIKQKNGKSLNALAVKAVDRFSNESDYMAKKVK